MPPSKDSYFLKEGAINHLIPYLMARMNKERMVQDEGAILKSYQNLDQAEKELEELAPDIKKAQEVLQKETELTGTIAQGKAVSFIHKIKKQSYGVAVHKVDLTLNYIFSFDFQVAEKGLLIDMEKNFENLPEQPLHVCASSYHLDDENSFLSVVPSSFCHHKMMCFKNGR